MRRDLVLAVAGGLAVILGAPYVGQLRGAVQAALPGQYRTIVGGVVAAAAAAAFAAALWRVREHRLRRYSSLAAALLIAVTYARVMRTGDIDQDLVEHFHFVEYGLVTFLFFRAWRHRGAGAALLLPLCAGLVVGILDEWFQWFVPSRVGELHDVGINAVAVVCGVLFSVGIYPLTRTPVSRNDGRAVALGLAAVVLAAAVFVDSVHLGHVVRDPRVGTFRSQFDAGGLAAASADRSARWPAQPPAVATGFAREDHYLSEGQWHVRRRNEAQAGIDPWRAWHENLILETFFAPVLGLGHRWSAEAVAEAEKTALRDPDAYLSNAEPYPVVAVGRAVFWAAVVAVVAGLWLFPRRRPAPAVPGRSA